ncbi:MAG TPA: glycoside hydrolase family 3 N-terminal domain-containing protein [Verrucomicrobiae bacterium]
MSNTLPQPNGWPGKTAGLSLCLSLSILSAFTASAEVAKSEYQQRVEALLSQMTLDEKIGQLTMLTGYGATTGPVKDQAALEKYLQDGQCGSLLNVYGVEQVRHLQQVAVEQSRLHIPLLFGFDTIHGYVTVFPISLGESASWNLDLIEQSAHIGAKESAAAGLNWTFAPMVDIARDPRWGRISEGAGEDPYLGSAIARARVRGFQGTDLTAPDSVLACVKHFAAYGAAEAGRDYNTVDMSERKLRETYLPTYKAAVDAGALSVMTSFNELNGTPATANRWLMQQILRDEWGFPGFIVTDYTAINEMVAHGSAADEADAGRQALNAGIDIDMVGQVYLKNLKTLLAEGKVTQAQIDTAAGRVLEIKYRLGLMDDPYRHCDLQREAKTLLAPENRALARQMAAESFVLLKNQNDLLPLKPGQKIAVLGPLADSRRDLLGSWFGHGAWDNLTTVLQAIQTNNLSGKTLYAKGCEVEGDDQKGFAAALKAARQADVVVMVLGERGDMCGEAKSRTSIDIPGQQTALLRAVKKLGKPVVVVLMNGRPLALEAENGLADAMLETWFPGTEGGSAVADVLFGQAAPGGRLPVTFPRNLGQVPIYYAAKNTGRPMIPANPKQEYRSYYIDSPNAPLYPFGYGLSYTKFKYSPVTLSGNQLSPGSSLTASVTVTNTGARLGEEVVQLYIRDLVGSVTRPLKELKGFKKIQLQPGETKTISFPISESDLTFLRADMTWGTEPGDFQVFVGPNSRDNTVAAFKLTAK